MDLNISKVMDKRLEIYPDIRNVLNRRNYLPSVTGSYSGYPEPGTGIMLRAGYKL